MDAVMPIESVTYGKGQDFDGANKNRR